MSAITAELLQRYEANEAANELLTIDPNTRRISLPRTEVILGVVADAYSENKYFGVPRRVSPLVDIADAIIYVAWKSEEDSSVLGIDICTDYSLNENNCVFAWTIPEKLCAVSGSVSFNVHFHTTRAEWHTTLAIGTVLDGNIMVDEVLDDDYQTSVGKFDLERINTELNQILAVTMDLDKADIDAIFDGSFSEEYMELVDNKQYALALDEEDEEGLDG